MEQVRGLGLEVLMESVNSGEVDLVEDVVMEVFSVDAAKDGIGKDVHIFISEAKHDRGKLRRRGLGCPGQIIVPEEGRKMSVEIRRELGIDVDFRAVEDAKFRKMSKKPWEFGEEMHLTGGTNVLKVGMLKIRR